MRVVTRSGLVHLALNKPQGMLSAMSDDRGRRTVADLLADHPPGLFHVGRLDADSEGLLLVTNDGDLAHRLTHPSYQVAKTYLVEVPGPLGRDVVRRLRSGVRLDDGPASADEVRIVGVSGPRVMVEVTLHEGRNHIVRRMMDAVGHPVRRLVRTRIGPVQLGNLKSGRTRHLTRHEVGVLYRDCGL
jgi:23S rRNA pseudouridine2605 synthase